MMREDLELEHWGPQTVVAAFLQGITSLVFPCRLYNPSSHLTATPLSPSGERRVEVSWPAGVQGAGQVRTSHLCTTHPLPGGGGRLKSVDKLSCICVK